MRTHTHKHTDAQTSLSSIKHSSNSVLVCEPHIIHSGVKKSDRAQTVKQSQPLGLHCICCKTWDSSALVHHKSLSDSSCKCFWGLNRFSQIGCITMRAEVQTALQSHRLQPEHGPRDTSIERESLHTFKRRQWTGGKPLPGALGRPTGHLKSAPKY